MKAENDSRRANAPANSKSKDPAQQRGRLTPSDWFALAFGLFLGLAIVKFGNPVILESKIEAPSSLAESWDYLWPPRWSLWALVPLALAGVGLAITRKARWPGTIWLWVLPVVWFGWQLISALNTVDRQLTLTTLWQLGGCVVVYGLGALVLGYERGSRLLLAGLLLGFTFCLVRAVQQRVYEFPQQKQFLLESESVGWTNMPPDRFLEMKQSGFIITTNGVDVANPIFIAKLSKGRVHGTLVYPNALAGVVLMLLPITLAIAVTATRRFRKPTRYLVIVLTLFLGVMGLIWTGSKSGWLIALALGGIWLFRLKWPRWAKWTTLALILIFGLAAFGIRFRNYFAAGATSVGARFDYWQAAVRTTVNHPVVGTGPGTFQRPYEAIKPPEAEMAKLAHNDYLEQFSDSGLIGGLSYAAWIVLLLVTLGKRVWRLGDPLCFALFVGLLGWFAQGLSEFGLYIPALAWTAFALSGCLLKLTGNQVDNIPSRR